MSLGNTICSRVPNPIFVTDKSSLRTFGRDLDVALVFGFIGVLNFSLFLVERSFKGSTGVEV